MAGIGSGIGFTGTKFASACSRFAARPFKRLIGERQSRLYREYSNVHARRQTEERLKNLPISA